MDFLDQGTEDIAREENKYSNDTRLDCGDQCNDCNRKLYLGFETFCCCYEGNMLDSLLDCVEIEDCFMDKLQKLETLISSDGNDSLEWLDDALKLPSNYSVSHNSLEIESQEDIFDEKFIQDILDMESEKLENPAAGNKPLDTISEIHKFEDPIVEDILDMDFEEPENPLAGNNNEEHESPVPKPSEPLEYTLMMFIHECLEEPSAEI